eukprot:gene13212-13343_t
MEGGILDVLLSSTDALVFDRISNLSSWKAPSAQYGLAASAALAAATSTDLARRAVDCLLVPCKADAVAAPSIGNGKIWNKGGSCPMGFSNIPSLKTNLWLYQALDAEELALQQGTQAQLPPYPDVLQQLVKASWNSLRELLTALTRSEIKHAINRHAPSRTAWKILKDPRDSLTRKALFYINTPSWQLLPEYISTMFRTQLPMYAAELIVACCYDAWEELRHLLYPPRKQLLMQQPADHLEHLPPAQFNVQYVKSQLQQVLVKPEVSHVNGKMLQDSSRRWLIKAGKNVVRVTGTAVCAAVGAGAAAAMAPRDRAGVWAVRGHIVTDLICANVLLLVLDGGLGVVFGPPSGDRNQHEGGHHHFGMAM